MKLTTSVREDVEWEGDGTAGGRYGLWLRAVYGV